MCDLNRLVRKFFADQTKLVLKGQGVPFNRSKVLAIEIFVKWLEREIEKGVSLDNGTMNMPTDS